MELLSCRRGVVLGSVSRGCSCLGRGEACVLAARLWPYKTMLCSSWSSAHSETAFQAGGGFYLLILMLSAQLNCSYIV